MLQDAKATTNYLLYIILHISWLSYLQYQEGHKYMNDESQNQLSIRFQYFILRITYQQLSYLHHQTVILSSPEMPSNSQVTCC